MKASLSWKHCRNLGEDMGLFHKVRNEGLRQVYLDVKVPGEASQPLFVFFALGKGVVGQRGQLHEQKQGGGPRQMVHDGTLGHSGLTLPSLAATNGTKNRGLVPFQVHGQHHTHRCALPPTPSQSCLPWRR